MKECQRGLRASAPVIVEPGVNIDLIITEARTKDVTHRFMETKVPFSLGFEKRVTAQLLPAGSAEIVVAVAIETEGRLLIEGGGQAEFLHP